jgi:hypothetical protein
MAGPAGQIAAGQNRPLNIDYFGYRHYRECRGNRRSPVAALLIARHSPFRHQACCSDDPSSRILLIKRYLLGILKVSARCCVMQKSG